DQYAPWMSLPLSFWQCQIPTVWQKMSLTHLLDRMEIAHKNDIKLYTSGHLNHNKLYKPSEKIKGGQWDSARKETIFMRERDQFLAQNERGGKMKIFSSNFYSSIPPLPAHTDSSFPTNRYPQTSVTRVGPPADVSLTPLESLNLKVPKKKVEETTDRLRMHLKRHELDVSGIMVLKKKPVKNSRQCVAEPAKEEYQFIPSYLAGITKTDQFNKFLPFQREFIANHELLQNDFTGSKVSEQHEIKLAKELQKICDCDPLHFKRLQVVEKVFENICNSSLIFGDILKEIKRRKYYPRKHFTFVHILLLFLHLQTLKAQVKGMETRPSKAQEIQAVRKDVQVLMKKAKSALERNQE
uniref:Translin-associated factor X-interacting protein 1 N-terminal domain-containing protein n=1 Tax=Apteryx owenii TaxID=8824 RepID=A0A8B9PIN9_APTOW